MGATGSEPEDDGHDALASVKFTGDPRKGFWWISVRFRSNEEISALIQVLTNLRDDPRAQRHHVHLSDYYEGTERGYYPAPEDAEVTFYATANAPSWILAEIDQEALADGARFMREFWRPPEGIRITGLKGRPNRRGAVPNEWGRARVWQRREWQRRRQRQRRRGRAW